MKSTIHHQVPLPIHIHDTHDSHLIPLKFGKLGIYDFDAVSGLLLIETPHPMPVELSDASTPLEWRGFRSP